MSAKNPWLSLWLSAANTWAGSARSFWTAEARRQRTSLLGSATKPAAAKPTATKSAKARPARSKKAKAGRRTSGR
jgi:hypothetical protein